MTITNATLNRLLGLDSSTFQGIIDWNLVKAAGVQFAFLKASEGITLQDDKFASNAKSARSVGIPYGAYHFFRPNDNVTDQVDNFCTVVGSLQTGDLPPFLDTEDDTIWTPYTLDQRITMITSWMSAVQTKLGVAPILYCSPDFAKNILGGRSELKQYLLFVADYINGTQPVVPAPWTDWTFWQQTGKGTLSGITGDVDLDYFNGTAADLAKLLVQAPATTATTTTTTP
jgi:lysozyme